MTEAEAILKRAFAERGYGVIATPTPHRRGDIIRSVNDWGDPQEEWRQSMVVTAETDRADYEAQSGRQLQWAAYPHYYRVMVD